jgi:hypothetical protein
MKDGTIILRAHWNRNDGRVAKLFCRRLFVTDGGRHHPANPPPFVIQDRTRPSDSDFRCTLFPL